MRKQFSKFTINKDKSRKGKKGVQHWIIRIAKTEHNAKYKTRFSGTFDEATAKADIAISNFMSKKLNIQRSTGKPKSFFRNSLG